MFLSNKSFLILVERAKVAFIAGDIQGGEGAPINLAQIAQTAHGEHTALVADTASLPSQIDKYVVLKQEERR